MGREARPKALNAVQKYILDEMGVTIKVKAKDTPPTEIPYYNPRPAAWWNTLSTEQKPPEERVLTPPPPQQHGRGHLAKERDIHKNNVAVARRRPDRPRRIIQPRFDQEHRPRGNGHAGRRGNNLRGNR